MHVSNIVKTGYRMPVMVGVVMAMLSCSDLEPAAPAEDTLLDGPVEGLTNAQQAQHLMGDIAFNDQVFTAGTGLGPLFVATSCGSCHAGDGKGHPFTTLTRFGQIDSTGNLFRHLGGPQLQHRAIPGYQPETIPPGATYARLTPPAITGLGFLELVSDADILERADPHDENGDGISGVPNWSFVPEYVNIMPGALNQGGKYICRFGKKASVYDLLQQTVGAYNQDIGITSAFEPVDVYSGLTTDPEVSDKDVRDVVFYLQTLKAPIQRFQDDPDVISGREIFIQIGCETCHRATFVTGLSPVEALSNKEFHPYTDLLLHDLGPGLDDGYTEGNAMAWEWRTPALWGLGLSPNSQGGQYFLMHDGRATSIEAAIELHGGEASQSQQRFTELSPSDKAALLRFLESL
jgi:CxxC motif-containing protein (DUF1111 family)